VKAIALVLSAIIGFTAAASFDREEWEALTEEERIQIIKRLVIFYYRKNGTREVDVLIKYEEKTVIILIRPQKEEA
jgi:hypothetical protein